MAYDWLDGFEIHQSATYIGRKYAVIGAPAGGTAGRLHGSACNMAGTTITTPSLGVGVVRVAGFGLRLATFDNATFLQFLLGGIAQTTLTFNASRQVEIRRGPNNGTIIATGTTQIPASSWVYIEVRLTITDNTGPATGTIEVHINEVSELNLSAIQTAPTANGDGADQVRFVGKSAVTCEFDDFWSINEDSGGTVGFRGDLVIEGILPTAAGASTQWSVTGAATNFDAVNDTAASPNNNDYVSSDTNGQIDYYEHGDLGFITGAVEAIAVSLGVRMDNAIGSRVIRPRFRRSSGTSGAGPNVSVSGTSVVEAVAVMEQDPTAGPGAWTLAEINAGQFGMEVVS